MCINSLCLLTETAFSSFNMRTRFARHTIVKLEIKSQFDLKLLWKRKNNTYVEENTNRAFQLELLVSHTERPKPLNWDVCATTWLSAGYF